MLFNSYVFIFCFLPAVLVGWWSLRGARVRLGFLTLSSWFFYAWWDWHFLPLMIGSTTVDYVAGRAIAGSDDERYRRIWLGGALSFNLALLGYFKYADFFINSLNGIGSHVGA